MKKSVDTKGGFPSYEDYVGKPFPVNASGKSTETCLSGWKRVDGILTSVWTAVDRMKENWAGRKTLCVYDQPLQNTQLIHFPSDHQLQARLLVHFYAFLFFEGGYSEQSRNRIKPLISLISSIHKLQIGGKIYT